MKLCGSPQLIETACHNVWLTSILLHFDADPSEVLVLLKD